MVSCSRAVIVVGWCGSNPITVCKSFCAHWPPITCDLEKVIYSSFNKYQELSGPVMLRAKQTMRQRVSLTELHSAQPKGSAESGFWEPRLFVQCCAAQRRQKPASKLIWVISPGCWVTTRCAVWHPQRDKGALAAIEEHSKSSKLYFLGCLSQDTSFDLFCGFAAEARIASCSKK